jgi:hypothetical protein
VSVIRAALMPGVTTGVAAHQMLCGEWISGKAHNVYHEELRPTMLPELFPTGTEFADVQGVPVSCTPSGICRAWDRDADRYFPIESLIYNGTIVTEAVFRELHRKRQYDLPSARGS